MNPQLLRLAACRGLPTEWFYPERIPGQDNHGAQAKALCAECPIRAMCLTDALRRNEEHGLFGGAGEARRRVLRRAMAEGRLEVVAAAHWRQLDGCPDPGDRALLAGNSEAMVCGKRSTYAKGHRCDACALAAAFDGQMMTRRNNLRRTA